MKTFLNKKHRCENCKKLFTMFTLCLVIIDDIVTILCPECLKIKQSENHIIKAL